MNKRANWFLLIGGVGIMLVLIRSGVTTRWKQEQSPPEQVSLLTLGMNGEILAQTPSGNLYELAPGWNLPWERFTEPAEGNRMGLICHTNHAHSYLILPLPRKVMSRVIEHCVASETGFHIEVVLLENGEVWSWKHESGGYDSLLFSVILCIAFVLGASIMLMGWGMGIYQWLKRN